MIDRNKLKRSLTYMYLDGIPKEIVRSIYAFYKNENLNVVHHLNPNYFKDKLRWNRSVLFKVLVSGLLHELFEMHWEVNCPYCNSSINRFHKLKDLNDSDYCPECQMGFHNHADHNIFVTVSIHKNLLKEKMEHSLHKGQKDNHPALNAIELIAYPPFREHFTAEVPRLDQSIRLRSVTVMFTDLIQSTALYHSMGDMNAYAFVQSHFNVMFQHIIEQTGGIIKTIGDAVMAVFQDGEQALKASLLLKDAVNNLLQENKMQGKSGLKIGLSRGTALIVNLNEAPDLFGTTVNLAARIVSLADNSCIAITSTLLERVEIKQFIKSHNLNVKSNKTRLKGFPSKIKVHMLCF